MLSSHWVDLNSQPKGATLVASARRDAHRGHEEEAAQAPHTGGKAALRWALVLANVVGGSAFLGGLLLMPLLLERLLAFA